MLHIGDDVGRLGQHSVQGIVGDGVDQPPPRVPDGGAVQPHPLKQLHRLVLEPPLGQGDTQTAAHTFTTLSPVTSKTSTVLAPFSLARLQLDSSVRQGESSQVPAGRLSTASSALAK